MASETSGEAVYSSDGLPPLAAPRVPKISVVNDEDCKHDDVLDTGDFVDLSSAAFIFSREPPKEGPKEKLARLQMEVSQLKNEIKSEDVSQLAADLSSRLETGVKPQDNLTQLFEEHLRASSITKSDQSGMVYELYGGTAVSSSSVEERLLKLEEIIGGPSTESLNTRMEAMEKMMKRVDEKAVEEAATRAKVIRSDLEAASKARSKLSNSFSSTDNKTISELHSQLIQLEGVSAHLPALTNRLQQLAHLHVKGVNFGSRLTEAEMSLSNIQGSLNNLENSIEKVEQGIAESVKTMDSNVRQLEERML